MYGMVLMAALTTAPDTPNFGWNSGCTGCTGSVSSCYGSSCFGSSCYGSSCVGSCHGGPLFPRLRSLFSGRGSSCHSSCYGSSCYGSSCFGSSCYGSSCYGSSCYGSSCYGSSSYFTPASYAAPGAVPHGHPVTITPGPGSGCFGDSYLNSSCYGSPMFLNRSGMLSGPTHYGTPVYSSTSFGYGVGFGSGPVYYGPDFHPTYSPCCEPGLGTVVTPPQVKIDRSEYDVTKAKPLSGPARLTVELPTDAKLFVDGTLTKGEGTTRNFHTPDLPAGQTFYYELKAEMTIDGKTVTDTKTVLVKAGEALSEGFPKLIAAAASKRDALAKK